MRRYHPPRPHCRCSRCKLDRRLDEIVRESAERVAQQAERILRAHLTQERK